MAAGQDFAPIPGIVGIAIILALPVAPPTGAAPFPDIATQIERTTPGDIGGSRNRPGTPDTAFCRVIDARPGGFIIDASRGGFPFGFAGQTPGEIGLA